MPAILLLIALFTVGHIGTGEACSQIMDLCFSLDDSSTVCGGDKTCDNWTSVLNFSTAVAATLDIGLLLNRVALVTFNNKTEVEWDLRKYPNKNQLLSTIGGVEFKGGVFNDIPSVNVILTQVFNPALGDNVSVKNVILVISDGIPNLETSVSQAASVGLQKEGITIFVVCVAPLCTEDWAQALASSPEKADLKTYFMVDGYLALESMRETVLEQICYFLVG